MLVKTYTSCVFGIEAFTITIEVNMANGINFFLVGLPDNAVKESHQRIRAAFSNQGLRFPGKEITINMAPADVRKTGSVYDLSIAIGILAVSAQVRTNKLNEYLIVGELSLDGKLQKASGILTMTLQAQKEGFKGIIVPYENREEASMVDGMEVFAAKDIKEVLAFLNGECVAIKELFNLKGLEDKRVQNNNFKHVKGQWNVKRALEIAAAGGHNLLMVGAPGSGKSMLAKCLPGILPKMTKKEVLNTSQIHSVTRKSNVLDLNYERPFRKPHHSISDIGLIGGGNHAQPGEISLAHNGVLFLDELPEFKRQVLEVLRQPLEDGSITISRANYTVDFPSKFMLVAAMNPCPCGYLNHPERTCLCSPYSVQKYLNKVSGPLMDRIDLHVEVEPVSFDDLYLKEQAEDSASVAMRVSKARSLQRERYGEENINHFNANITKEEMNTHCILDDVCKSLLKKAMQKIGFSARGIDKLIKVARTIADLEQSEDIKTTHLAEAIQYRSMDISQRKGHIERKV